MESYSYEEGENCHEKSKIYFSITWIILYVVVMGNLRNNFGDESPYSLLSVLIIAAILTVFIVKNRLIEKFGLIRCADSKKSLYSISGDIE